MEGCGHESSSTSSGTMSALSAFLSVGMGSYWQHSFSSILNSNDVAAAPAVKNGMLMLRRMWVTSCWWYKVCGERSDMFVEFLQSYLD